ncbi:MAG: phosphoribosylaminoimidazolesuccinocarboxamide synthase [Candidatus Theseobacter exili]|nr:phosphoribosylaminoimidazolesuccinocarboxamide synthase [Candidatus Theseobacter exili]
MSNPLSKVELKGIPFCRSGKVRDMYKLEEGLLIVATDRISAFDHILPNPVPDKGKILTGISEYWFEKTADIVPNHIISFDVEEYPMALDPYKELLRGRSMLVKEAKLIEIECVVRGYLSGSAWKEYRDNGTVCEQTLKQGYRESDIFDEPLFTPSTKAFEGHDENISIERMISEIGEDTGSKIMELSKKLFNFASRQLKEKGLILADTKYEFGLCDGGIIVIDEMMTPDSSRYWIADEWEPGRSQQAFDKQYVRDWLEKINWNKQPPVPELPEEVIQKTVEKYKQVYKWITGEEVNA